MNKPVRVRMLACLWFAAFGLLVAVWLFPVSNRFTRVSGLALLFVVWFWLIGLCWRRRAVRLSLLSITFLSVGFLALPARSLPTIELLRSDYVVGLLRYDGAPYYWGGESHLGIDCSGLIRRGLIDSLFCRGVRTFDPGLVRRALSLWWNDTTASALGQQHHGLTVHLLDTSSINLLDHSQILPGDLAVTRNGLHIMAYLGNHVWIEADPDARRVIRVTAPSPENRWFQTSMSIMRWNILEP